jgi:hypothetical protein
MMTKIKNFTQTSDLPYNRHNYKLFFKNGKIMEFDNWEDAQVYWFQWFSTDQLDLFEVLDQKKTKTKSKGF